MKHDAEGFHTEDSEKKKAVVIGIDLAISELSKHIDFYSGHSTTGTDSSLPGIFILDACHSTFKGASILYRGFLHIPPYKGSLDGGNIIEAHLCYSTLFNLDPKYRILSFCNPTFIKESTQDSTENLIGKWIRNTIQSLLTEFFRIISFDGFGIQLEKFLYHWFEKVQSYLKFVSKILRSHRQAFSLVMDCLTKICQRFRNYWPPDKLTKPIIFVVDNADWTVRYSLLSTPLVPALCTGSKDLI